MAELWKKQPKAYGRRYPWKRWFQTAIDKGNITLVKERDFPDVMLHGFCQMVRTTAKKHGYVAHLKTTDTMILVTLTELEPNTPPQEKT